MRVARAGAVTVTPGSPITRASSRRISSIEWPGKDPAIDVGIRTLGQGIGRMPAIEQRRHTRRAQVGMEETVCVDCFGLLVAWVGRERDHGLADLIVPRGARLDEVLLRGLGHFQREFMLVDLREGPRQLVDGVVAHRR